MILTMKTSDMGSPTPTWFITGCSTGFGRELALAALRRGDRVAVTGRRLDGIRDLAEAHPGRAIALELDVRDEAAARRAVADTMAAFGRIDVVVNNAGYGLFGGVEEATDSQARAIFDTNVFGVLNVLRATLPVLRTQRSGHILQLSSMYGQSTHAGVGLLSATKYAIEGLSEALAAELAPLGVRLTVIQPSFYGTSFLANLSSAESIDDYDGSVGAVRRSLGGLTPDALGDPARAAAAMLAVVDSENPPLHLALGAQSEGAIRTTLTGRISELDAWQETTRAAFVS